MLESERHHIVTSLLRQYRFMSVHDLAKRLEISLATVRRDLDKLEESGSVRRVHGGAELVPGPAAEAAPSGVELPFDRRKDLQVEQKRRIAEKAVSLCDDGETIIIDGGSTTFHMVPYLLNRNLRILTNSFAMAEMLVGRSRNQVVLPAGTVDAGSKLVRNPFENDLFKDYVAARVFMGVNGVGPAGVTNTDESLIRMERSMIERGRRLYVLADGTKFSRHGDLLLCGFDRITAIITDSGIAQEHREMVASRGVSLIVA